MEGLIQSEQPADSRDDLTAEKVTQGIQIPAELQDAYGRVVAAGMSAMFSEKSNKAAVGAMMRGQGSVAEKLGQAIAGLLGMLVKTSNNTIPPQILIPAGVELLIQAADFLRKAKLAEINNQVIGDAMDVMVTTIFKAAGLSVDQVVGFVEQQAKGGGGQGQPQPQPAQPPMGA